MELKGVFYSLHYVSPTFGFAPSPIDKKEHVEMAEKEARTAVTLTWGDLQIILLVCCEAPDDEVYKWLNFLKEAYMFQHQDFRRSQYSRQLSEPYKPSF
jgi:hypothetical protein